MKKSLVLLISIFCVVMLSGVQTAFCEMSNYELEQEVKVLKKQLKERKGILDKFDAFEKWSERLSFSGLIEVEAFTMDGYNGEDESDITLATVELGLDAQIADWVSGQIVLLWEEDDTEPMDVDVGTITLGNMKMFPIYLTAGKMYVPFGNFESNMIQDPLTLEIGETRESAVQVGFEHSGFYGSVYTFNGDIDENGEDNEVKCFGANAGYAFENDNISFDIGAGWINNLIDSDGLGDRFEEMIEGYATDTGSETGWALRDYVDGFAVHAIINFGPATLIGEYVGAADDIEWNVSDDTAGATMAALGRNPVEKTGEPKAWNLELAYTVEVMSKETTFALGFQGTDDLAGILPEERYMASIGVGIAENTSFTLEYLHDEDYDQNEGGTGDDADMVTVQLAIEF